VLSIDIGIINFALLVAIVDDETFEIKELELCKLINIKNLRCRPNQCPFKEKKTPSHWMFHLFNKYSTNFEQADVVLVERQPFVGLNNIESLILFKFPEKTILQNPKDLHKFLGMREQDASYYEKCKYDYEERKDIITEMASKEDILTCMPAWKNNTRLHDLGDAWYFIKMYCSRQKTMKEEKNLKRKFTEYEYEDSDNKKSKYFT
jgi:hypothetical protein